MEGGFPVGFVVRAIYRNIPLNCDTIVVEITMIGFVVVF